jgi:plastocyanin
MKPCKLTTLLIALAIVPFAAAGCGGDDDDGGGGGDTAAQTQSEETTAPEATEEATTDDGGTEAPSGGGEPIEIAADEGGALKFDQTALTAPAGEVTIVMDNPSSVPHAVAIKAPSGDASGDTVGQGEKSTATAELEPGEYEFYCPVGGHEAAGMKGTLTVE